MYAQDFEYDGKLLSNYGFIIGKIDPGSDIETIGSGSKIELERVSYMNGKRHGLASSAYKECIQATFDICKSPCIYDQEEMEITFDEFREIVRWLNRGDFHKLRFFDFSHQSYNDVPCYYNATFNLEKIMISERLYGLRLTMETDMPFGYANERTIKVHFASANTTKTISDVSDEIGYIYPTVIATCNQSGDLVLRNEDVDCETKISGCKTGEVITLHGDTNIIETSDGGHDIANDFNYDFFKIGNSFGRRINRVTASMPCDVVIKYTPYIKEIV